VPLPDDGAVPSGGSFSVALELFAFEPVIVAIALPTACTTAFCTVLGVGSEVAVALGTFVAGTVAATFLTEGTALLLFACDEFTVTLSDTAVKPYTAAARHITTAK